MGETTTYAFRKSILEKERHFALLDEGLHVVQEHWPPILIPYERMQSIRVFYQPFRYRTYNYTCIIECNNITLKIYSTSYEAVANFKDLREQYTPFVKELVQRKNAADKTTAMYAGNSSFTYYGYIALIVLTLIGLSVLFSFIPFVGTIGVVLNLFLMAYYLGYTLKMFRVNYPRQMTGGIVPDNVLPTSKLSLNAT